MLVCRLMSGFTDSLHDKVWRPTGTPAIRHLIGSLDQSDHDIDLVFTRAFNSRREDAPIHALRGQGIRLEGLRMPVSFFAEGPGPFGRFGFYVREIMHATRLWLRSRRTRPDVIYADRSNILTAAVLARWGAAPVVLRLLGVPPDLHHIFDNMHPARMLLRWAYRSPFALVVSTREGSGSDRWLEKALNSTTPREVLLNGVQKPVACGARPAFLEQIPRDRMIVTFLGRIEAIKGAEFFVDALLALPPDARSKIQALIVGDGSQERALREKVAACGNPDGITFTGALAPQDVMHVLIDTHVYVSLNRQGHLSNATLEALAAGVCLVMQRIKPSTESDTEFEEIVPIDEIVAIDRGAPPEELARVLTRLAESPEEREALAAGLHGLVKPKLVSWDERIAYEIGKIEDISQINAVNYSSFSEL